MKRNKTNLAILKSLGLQRASDLLPTSTQVARLRQTPTTEVQHGVDLTNGVNPIEMVDLAIQRISDRGMKTYMELLVAEPEVLPQLTQRTEDLGVTPCFIIQNLRFHAERVQHSSAMQREVKEVLYVATLVLGIQHMLAKGIVGNSSARDVMFTIARPHLYALERTSPLQASFLRQCLGWGNEDEVEVDFILQLQARILKAVKTALGIRQTNAPQARRNGNSSS